MPSELLHLIFGRNAALICSVSPRLELWAAAFDDWLDSVQARHGTAERRQAHRNWEMMLSFDRRPP